MKVMIDKDGWLLIERSNVYKEQYCPSEGGTGAKCGDWCPLFGEPAEVEEEKTILSL